MYALLSNSKQQLSDRLNDLEESADVYLQMLDAAKDYRDHLMGQVEQVETAEMRILCMLATINARLEAQENGGSH